jgi:hypothetical protein
LKTSLVLLTTAYILTASSASPEVAEKTQEIRDAAWQEVMDTAGTDEGYTDPAFIDINGISRNGDLIIFDVVNPDASYGRVEGNCKTNQFRSLRFGRFLSSTKISYIEQNNVAWSDASSYQRQLLKFACGRSS